MKGKSEESSSINAFLGKNTTFSGGLVFEGLVRIDGNFEGTVKTPDVLVVANSGKVKAEIEVGVARISGYFEGTIVAKEKVELLKPANVNGTIKTKAITIEEGVTFNGTCEMGNLDNRGDK
jgi:cytoskeletal protein CcmA (bactofilin family)